MSKDRSYATKKARMDRDPEFKTRVLAAQARSRRKRTDGRWLAFVELNGSRGVPVCQHEYPNGRRCWRVHPHRHGGIEHPVATS
jgi:hypothetical protein